MGMPLQEVSRRGHGDDDPRTSVRVGARASDQLLDRLRPRAGEISEQLAAAVEQRPQQARDGQHEVAVGDGEEHLLVQPLSPPELLLLLAGGA